MMSTQNRSGIITLLTDFGAGSPYVAEMKAAILTTTSQATIVDLTHSIAPQNIREAAWILARTVRSFPVGTIHVAVVDPGVGSDRKIVAVECGGQIFIAPDNGLLAVVAADAAFDVNSSDPMIHQVTNADYFRDAISSTFHGRDIMAPVAAYLLAGKNLASCGPKLDRLADVAWNLVPRLIDESTISGEVAYVDSFGNLITNVKHTDLPECWEFSKVNVELQNVKIEGIVPTYSSSVPGSVIAIIGSSGLLEISVVNGNCAKQLQCGAGQGVVLKCDSLYKS
ncbi:MAG: hypothetical protein COA78_08240 [Blastopirellula sp.]|nr:MAG: hypothetical protein COA78_08240 [Blastopirellula sp.]